MGISLRLWKRVEEHLREQGWAGEIDTMTIERFPSADDAAEAEVIAIKTEKPLYNKSTARAVLISRPGHGQADSRLKRVGSDACWRQVWKLYRQGHCQRVIADKPGYCSSSTGSGSRFSGAAPCRQR